MANQTQKILDKQYMDKGDWKCDKSPTSAHYWIITKERIGKIMTCKHCGQIKHLDEDISISLYKKN